MIVRKYLYIIIGNLYRYTFQAAFNIIGNSYWYARLILSGKYFQIQRIKKYSRANRLNVILDHSAYMHDGISKRGLFRRWPTWTATFTIMIYRAQIAPGRSWIIGNCQDFAHLARVFYGNRARIRIFCPARLADLDRVHYLAEIEGIGVVSNTSFRAETPDQCAARMLDGAEYFWIA